MSALTIKKVSRTLGEGFAGKSVKRKTKDYWISERSSGELIRQGYLHFEKCELREATETFHLALDRAKEEKSSRAVGEALSALLRFAGEALDEPNMIHWEKELDALISRDPSQVPPMAWYCKGVIQRYRGDWKSAQKNFHVYLRSARSEKETQERKLHEARAYTMLATCLFLRTRYERATWLANEILRRYGQLKLRGINGVVYLLLGNIAESQGSLTEAMEWYRRAHGIYLEEHNWYHHLYVLYGYARISRLEKNFKKSYWYLDLIEKAASGPEFGILQREVEREKKRLEDDAVDLLIDPQNGIVKTREGGEVSLRKQYVLLDILKALSTAHETMDRSRREGLSKAEIIRQVWRENYRPEAHDNKLYYNINRLRKLIEPNVRKPQYLLNWKEGYRFAPGLRVQFVGEERIQIGRTSHVQKTDERRIQ